MIYEELVQGVIRDDSRSDYLNIIDEMVSDGAGGVIAGCTEIELLIQQEHVPELPLIPSAETHIDVAAEVLLGHSRIDDVLPPG